MSDVNDKDHRLEDILAYQQGFLSNEKKAELEQHLRGCEACQRTFKEVSSFLPAMQQALTLNEPSSEEMLAKAMAQIRARPPKPAPFLTRVRLGMLALAATAAGIIFTISQLLSTPAAIPVAGIVDSPRPPVANQVDAGSDGGVDGGMPDAGGRP